MVALYTPDCQFDSPAKAFELPDTAGKIWNLESCKGDKGLLVMFICNHCPYVKAIIQDLVTDIEALKELGVHTVAIMSNDVHDYPEDSPEQMAIFARAQHFEFPYLYDESQQVAKSYGAVCTPDFFGFNADLQLQYRGRFDASGMKRHDIRKTPELLQAMTQVAETGKGPALQYPSIGCSIKWREL